MRQSLINTSPSADSVMAAQMRREAPNRERQHAFSERMTQRVMPSLYIRLFGYLMSFIILSAAIYTHDIHLTLWWVPLFTLLYPTLTHFLYFPLQRQLGKPVSATMILLDTALCGAAIVLFGFDPIVALALYMIISAATVTIGGFAGWFMSMCTMALGAIFALMFSSQPDFRFQIPSLSMLVICLLCMTFYSCTLGYLSYRKTKKLMSTQRELTKKQREAAEMSRKLSRYLPPQVWGSIFSGQTEAKLATQRKKLTVFFSDIKGFAQISEELQPEALTDLLNRYFDEMSSIALKYGGTIDKFVGDAIMIFFGDPSSRGQQQDAQACVSMALEMQKKMKHLRQHWIKEGITKPLQVRMGINTGYCTVGNFGAETRMDYTIIGREVNLASRLESVAQPDSILISESTYNLVKDVVVCRDRGQINVKGFSRTVPIFEIIDHREELGLELDYFECEKDGFTLYLDTDKLRNTDRATVERALEDASRRIREKLTAPTQSE